MPGLPFFKPVYHRVLQWSKMDPQTHPCFFLNFVYNHGSDYFKIVDAEMRIIVNSRKVTWHQPREPLTSAAPTVRSGISYPPSGAETLEYVYIQSPPVATATTAATPAPALATNAPVPASALPLATTPAPAPLFPPPAPIHDCIVRELGHEADVRMPGRTRGETRVMQDS